MTGFRPLPDEAIVELAPDVIVAMRRCSDNDAHDLSQLFDLKGVQSTPAGTAKRIIMMDGLYLLGFGPRAPAAARDLMAQFYPDVIGQSGGKARARTMTAAAAACRAACGRDGWPTSTRLLIGGAAVGLCVAIFLSLSIGATGITLASLPRVLSAMLTGRNDADVAREQLVLIDIRLPRLLLGMFVGAALAVAGAMMQGMFRNPLADPGLIGVSSGAALAAVATIALGNGLAAPWIKTFGAYALPVAAFVGGIATT